MYIDLCEDYASNNDAACKKDLGNTTHLSSAFVGCVNGTDSEHMQD